MGSLVKLLEHIPAFVVWYTLWQLADAAVKSAAALFH